MLFKTGSSSALRLSSLCCCREWGLRRRSGADPAPASVSRRSRSRPLSGSRWPATTTSGWPRDGESAVLATRSSCRDGALQAAWVVRDLTGVSIDPSTAARRRGGRRPGFLREISLSPGRTLTAAGLTTAPSIAISARPRRSRPTPDRERAAYTGRLIDGIAQSIADARRRPSRARLRSGSATQETPVSFSSAVRPMRRESADVGGARAPAGGSSAEPRLIRRSGFFRSRRAWRTMRRRGW